MAQQLPGEIITLQLGGFANYVGAHFWNLQVGFCLLLLRVAGARTPLVSSLARSPLPVAVAVAEQTHLRPLPNITQHQDELLGYASLSAGADDEGSLADAMGAPAVCPAAAATVEPSALFELRDRAAGGGGGNGAGSNTAFGRGFAVPRVVCMDVSGATGGVSFSPDAVGGQAPSTAAARASGNGGNVGGGVGAPSLHRAPPIPKSAFVRALEAQEALVRELQLRPAYGAPVGGGGGEAARQLEERQQRQLEAAARALDEATAEAGLDLPLAARGGGGGGGGSADSASVSRAADAVRYWTDYLKAQLHPRSAVLVPGVWHGVHALDGYGAGGGGSAAGGGRGAGGGAGGALSGGAAAGAAEAAVDALRRWGEACDRLQGLQVLADDMTGFGALGAAVLREATDDLFPRRPVLYFSLRGPDRPGSVLAAAGGGGGGGAGRRGGGGGDGTGADAEDDDDDDDHDEFGPGKSTGRGAGSRVGGGGGGHGGPAGARSRQLLSEALSAAEVACPEDGFASLYVPLAAPAPGSAEARALPWIRQSGGGGGGSGGSALLSAPGVAFRASALLAAAIDTATLPSRIPSGCPTAAVGPAVGAGASLAELCRALQARPTGGCPAPMAALGLAFPADGVRPRGGVGGGGGGGGGGGDDRAAGGSGRSGGSGGISADGRHRQQQHQRHQPPPPPPLYHSMALPAVASFTPGVRIGRRRDAADAGADGAAAGGAAVGAAPASSSSGGGRLLAESVVLRGSRDAATGRPSSLADAAAALDAALVAERRRAPAGARGGGGVSGGGADSAWLQQRCVAAPPVAVPLPFPGFFSGRVTRDGCVRAGGGAGGGGGWGHHVASAPAMTRLAASGAFSARLAAHGAALRSAARGGGLGTVAAAWGYDGSELGELGERLARMAGGGED